MFDVQTFCATFSTLSPVWRRQTQILWAFSLHGFLCGHVLPYDMFRNLFPDQVMSQIADLCGVLACARNTGLPMYVDLFCGLFFVHAYLIRWISLKASLMLPACRQGYMYLSDAVVTSSRRLTVLAGVRFVHAVLSCKGKTETGDLFLYLSPSISLSASVSLSASMLLTPSVFLYHSLLLSLFYLM